MFEPTFRRFRMSLLAAVGAGLVGCGSLDSASNRALTVVSPYRMDIVQGNFVSREQAQALRPGMSRAQVRDILGTPLVVSVFHADRWDYVFTIRRQGLEPQSRKLAVFFKGDVLERVEADTLPTEAEFAASLDARRKDVKVPVLELSPQALAELPVPAKPAAAKPLPPLPASYPPLEPAASQP